MKENYTEIVMVLDRSGSMNSVRADSIGGINSFLKKQKEDNLGKTNFTLVQFDNEYSVIHSGKDIMEIPDLDEKTYIPRGSTALYDSVGRTINEVGSRLATLKEEDRPSKVIFVILTDGFENASTEFKKEKIKEMIEHQTSKYSWDFIYLSCDLTGMADGCSLGVLAANNLSYNKTKQSVLYSTLSSSCTRGKSGQSVSFSDTERSLNK